MATRDYQPATARDDGRVAVISKKSGPSPLFLLSRHCWRGPGRRFRRLLYLINGRATGCPHHRRAGEGQQTQAQGNGLPQEKWSYRAAGEQAGGHHRAAAPAGRAAAPALPRPLTLQPEKLPQPVATEIPSREPHRPGEAVPAATGATDRCNRPPAPRSPAPGSR